jgi:hypothetical protein
VLLAHQGRNTYDIAKCLTSDGADGAPASVTYCTDSLPQLWHPSLDVWSGLLQLTDYQGRELDGTRSEPLTTSATVQVWVPSPLH